MMRTSVQGEVLEELHLMEPATVKALAEGVGRSEVAVRHALDRLKAQGLVRRVTPSESLSARGPIAVYETTEEDA